MCGKPIDITGKRFGRLTAIECVGTDPLNHAMWLCQCDCGETKVVNRVNLIAGTTKSCGCLAREKMPCFTPKKHTTTERQEPIELCPEGAANLIKAIIRQASNDVMHLPPSSHTREEAIKFFRSDYFKNLTGLEGEPILRHLLEEYERKHQKKRKEIKQ